MMPAITYNPKPATNFLVWFHYKEKLVPETICRVLYCYMGWVVEVQPSYYFIYGFIWSLLCNWIKTKSHSSWMNPETNTEENHFNVKFTMLNLQHMHTANAYKAYKRQLDGMNINRQTNYTTYKCTRKKI